MNYKISALHALLSSKEISALLVTILSEDKLAYPTVENPFEINIHLHTK
jgi:hypothetical protein